MTVALFRPHGVFLTMVVLAAPQALGARPNLSESHSSFSPILTPGKGKLSSGTAPCSGCHVTSGWGQVKFAHEKTGFPLRGKHERVGCKDCHLHNFTDALVKQCESCHADPHQGELGARCASCHDEHSWASRFDIDAHRTTNFPLVGSHATIPCEECHTGAPAMRFARSTVDCQACHERDRMRTLGTAIDHQRLNFGNDCNSCHGSQSFTAANFPGHDSCFEISRGPHTGLACRSCHSSLSVSSGGKSCSTQTAACSSCHTHSCSAAGGQTPTDKKHAQVPGYQCKDRKCYECHRSP